MADGRISDTKWRTGHRERASGPSRQDTANHALGFAEAARKILLNTTIAMGDAFQQHHHVAASKATTRALVVAEASLVAAAGLKGIRARRRSAWLDARKLTWAVRGPRRCMIGVRSR